MALGHWLKDYIGPHSSGGGSGGSGGGTDLVVIHGIGEGEDFHIAEPVDEVVAAMLSDALVMFIYTYSEGNSTQKNSGFVTSYTNGETQIIEVTRLNGETSMFEAEDGYFYPFLG